MLTGSLSINMQLKEYYDASGLRSYENVDVSRMRGQQLMDGSAVNFVEGTRLDIGKTMGFHSQEIYCVVPIAVGNETLETYDFWAVGTGCCSGIAQDFHCGEWNN